MVTMDDIKKARVRLVCFQPFFGSLALGLTPVLTDTTKDGQRVDIAGTDGRYLYVNPLADEVFQAFCSSQGIPYPGKQKVLQQLVCHEVLHPALGHLWRKGGRRMEKWNVATDLAIHEIMERGGIGVPPGGLRDRRLDGLSAEEKYARLPDPPKRPGSGQGEGKSAADSDLSKGRVDTHLPPSKSDSQSDGDGNGKSGTKDTPKAGSLEREWQRRLVSAVQSSRRQGVLPNWLERQVDDIIEPPIPVEEFLREYLVDSLSGREDFSFSRPNKASLAGTTRCVLPGLKKGKDLLDLVVAVDTSGSITDEDLALTFGVLVDICVQFENVSLTVIDCDAQVHHVWRGVRVDEVNSSDLKFTGGGGTDFRPVFRSIEEEDLNPRVLLYLTDLYGAFPEGADYDVLWLTRTTEVDPPFGTKILLEV